MFERKRSFSQKMRSLLMVAIMLLTSLTGIGFALPSYADEVIYSSFNTAAVQNNPSNIGRVEIVFEKNAKIDLLTTYHWNNGKGDPPGFIAIYSANGEQVGQWNAIGRGGSGRNNIGWEITPNIELSPGTYYVVDSNPQTWSANSQSGYEPFVEIKGSLVEPKAPSMPSQSSVIEWNGHRYERIEESMTWHEAKAYCESRGGHLATVTSKEEQKIIENLIRGGNKNQYWLGATDENDEGNWRWITGEPFAMMSSGGFDNYQGNEHYLEVYRHNWGDESRLGQWNDINNENYIAPSTAFFSTEHVGLICEYSPDLPQGNTFNSNSTVSDTWTGTWEATGEKDGNDVFYIEQQGNRIYGVYYRNRNDDISRVYGNFIGEVQSDGSIIGFNWWYANTGTPQATYTLSKENLNLTMVRHHYGSGNFKNTLTATKISDSFPPDKMFYKNKDFKPPQSSGTPAPVQPATPKQPTQPAPTPTEPSAGGPSAIPITDGTQKGNTSAFNGATGVSVSFPNTGAIGYRLYRSETEGDLGISVTDFYITSVHFTDVNVEPNTTYYYTLREVLAEADPLNDKRETLGAVIAKWTTRTSSEIGKGFKDPTKTRHFIMLKIDDPKMSVDGISKEVDPGRGTAPTILRGRTMVPIRAIVESMGGSTGWQGATREVSLKLNQNTVKMWVDKKELEKNSVKSKIDVPPSIMNSRTFVPLRFGAENLDCQIDWINSTKSIVVVWSE